MLTPDRAEAVAATLDRDRAPRMGEALPPLWHWTYFTPKAPLSALGVDGHPKLGGFMPPVPLPRRMWVGGRLRFVSPLRAGDRAVRTTEIRDVTAKVGKAGALVFVTLRHEVSTESGPAIVEEQDLVYREARTPGAAATDEPQPPRPDERAPAEWRDPLVPGPVLLFRYSAVTFNAHRIHYDEAYAREEEGYPGLVMHGPLTATLLVERLMQRTSGALTEFSFRAVRPLFGNRPMALCGNPVEPGRFDLWAETPDGQTAMSAQATISLPA
ncbi:MAG TPA: MaoC family dehydratase N-terminal domain-containing protein [Paracoccaceae bacterium]|nr:MaoC family dehydratase N-terminal domain-containing protein [Paracoccaceae bacterium]